MGLFDNLSFDPQSYNGGFLGNFYQRLLDELQPDARGYAPPAYGQAQPAPTQQPAMPPVNQVPAMQPQPQPSAGPDLGDRLGAGFLGFLNSQNGGALGNLIQGLGTGKRTDPQGQALQQQQDVFHQLVKGGTPPDQAMIIAQNPDAMKAWITQQVAPKQDFGIIAKDMLGNEQYGFRNTTAGTVTPYRPQGGAGTLPTGPDGQPLQGPDLMAYLKRNDPVTAAGVQGLIDGDISAGRNLQKLLPIAKMVDPSMAQYDYESRKRTRLEYTSGRASREIKAANTAIYHADNLSNLVDKLGNSTFLPGVVNPVSQAIKGQTSPEFQDVRGKYDSTAEALAVELSKAFNGGQTSDADRQKWRQVLDSAKSPAELKSAIGSAMQLLLGRFNASAENYNQGMGTAREGLHFVDQANRPIFDRLMGGGAAAPVGQSSVASGKYLWTPDKGLVPQ